MPNSVLVLQILEMLGAGTALGVSEFARRLSTPKSSTQRALKDLASAGWIHDVGAESVRWALTPKVLAIAAGVGGATGVTAIALAPMETLRDETGENVHLVVRDDADVVLVERLDSPHVVRIYQPLGLRVPAHATATGKAILASLADAAVEDYLSQSLARMTTHTVTSPADVRAEITEIRQRGFALNEGGYRDDVSSVAAAIRDTASRPIAALSVSGPAVRLPRTRLLEIGPKVARVAALISTRLGLPDTKHTAIPS